MKKEVTYLSEIINALIELDGMGSLSEINNIIQIRNKLGSIKTNPKWKNNVSAVIQRHCSQTKSYDGLDDIFYSVYGLGEGYWGIRTEEKELSENNPIEKRQISKIEEDIKLSQTEKEMIVRARIGQGIFRERLIEKYHGCIITGISDQRLLIASHIKPWRNANNEERLSSDNGILLSPFCDKLFDEGFISFENNMRVIISNQLSYNDVVKGGINKMESSFKNPSKQMQLNLEYHRDVIFQK